MQRIPRDKARKYALDWRDDPLLKVQIGESFEIDTEDASTGYSKLLMISRIPVSDQGMIGIHLYLIPSRVLFGWRALKLEIPWS